MIVGHHPHVTQPWERRGNGVIFYSLGNLVFDQSQRTATQHGALAEVVFSGKTLESAALLPVVIVGTSPHLVMPAAQSGTNASGTRSMLTSSAYGAASTKTSGET